jgi:GGDEF domain-containing protein
MKEKLMLNKNIDQMILIRIDRKIKDILKEAKEDVLLDHLTRINNRKSHEAELKRVVSRIKRSNEEINTSENNYYLLIDLDKFKKINDMY